MFSFSASSVRDFTPPADVRAGLNSELQQVPAGRLDRDKDGTPQLLAGFEVGAQRCLQRGFLAVLVHRYRVSEEPGIRDDLQGPGRGRSVVPEQYAVTTGYGVVPD